MTTEQITAIAERVALDAYPGLTRPLNHADHADPRHAYAYAVETFLPHLLDLMGRVRHGRECVLVEYVTPPTTR